MTGDADLRASLRAMDDADADARLNAERLRALHERVLRSGASLLAARRQRRTWWDYSASWSRVAVSMGLAASLLAAALLLRAPTLATNETAVPATTLAQVGGAALRAVTGATAGQFGSTEMLDSLVGPATRDGLYTRLLRGAP